MLRTEPTPGSDGSFSHPLFVSAVLKDAVQNWPHSDPVSWAQRASTLALVRRLDRSVVKASAAVKQSDPLYFRGADSPACVAR